MNDNRLLAIINPVSGTKNKAKLPELLDHVFGNSPWHVETVTTERPGHAKELASDAVRQGFAGVLAIGGDGTVNEVGAALCDTDTALGIIPVGSGNGLARHLRMSMNAARAMQTVAQGNIEQFDYCTVNDRPFFCTCGVGFDAQVSHKFANEGTRGFITYLRTTIGEYFKYHAQHYRISIDDYTTDEDAFVIACCNAAQYGNNAFIAPRATMQDGFIDITVMHSFNLASAALIGARMFSRNIDNDRHVTIYRGREVVIERDHEDVMHIDGDPCVMPARLDIKCHPGGIRLFVPVHEDYAL